LPQDAPGEDFTGIGQRAIWAAAAVAKVLGFGDRLMLNALSVAASHSSGLLEYSQTGGSVKRLHAGLAASGGIQAAFLAQAGLTDRRPSSKGTRAFAERTPMITIRASSLLTSPGLRHHQNGRQESLLLLSNPGLRGGHPEDRQRP